MLLKQMTWQWIRELKCLFYSWKLANKHKRYIIPSENIVWRWYIYLVSVKFKFVWSSKSELCSFQFMLIDRGNILYLIFQLQHHSHFISVFFTCWKIFKLVKTAIKVVHWPFSTQHNSYIDFWSMSGNRSLTINPLQNDSPLSYVCLLKLRPPIS